MVRRLQFASSTPMKKKTKHRGRLKLGREILRQLQNSNGTTPAGDGDGDGGVLRWRFATKYCIVAR